MYIFRKITTRELTDFVLSKHPELRTRLGLDPQIIRRICRFLSEGDMQEFLESKGFTKEVIRLEGESGKWAILCGKAAA